MNYIREDVVTAVKRTFPPERTLEVMGLLDGYGPESDESERARVQLAIVKLSDGDERKLIQFVDAAAVDFRDVLYWAEYPGEPGRDAELLIILRREWAWLLPNPICIIAINPFGNVVVKCADGELWRVCSEELSAEKLAGGRDFAALLADEVFREDWLCEAWVISARATLGDVGDGECYGFKIWPKLGGVYSADNFAVKKITEWLAVSGDVARQVKDLPDGTRIHLDTGNG